MRALAPFLLVALAAPACANVECSLNSDCPQNARCEMNRCVRDCAEDRDCLSGEYCDPRGLCVSRTPTADVGPADVTVDRPVSVDAGFDAGPNDSGPVDTGVVDTGPRDTGFDAGPIDTGFDAGPADTGPVDLGPDPADNGAPDTGPRDAGPLDTGIDAGHDGGVIVLDVGFPDTGPRDTGPVDTGPRDSGTTTGPVPVGVYEYTGIRPDALSAPVAVAWHPSGDYALILSYRDTVFRYDASTQAVTRVATAGSTVYWRNLTFTPDGARALLLAYTVSGSTQQGRIYEWDHNTSTLTERMSERSATNYYDALVYNPEGTQAVLMSTLRSTTSTSSSTFTLWRYDANGNRLTTPSPIARGILGQTACNDVAWVRDGFGDPAFAVVCGVNTGGGYLITNIDGTPVIVANPTSSQTGNMAHITSRPQGDLAFAVGSSSSKLYRYRAGLWEVGFDRPQLNGISAVAFSDDGNRALAYGGQGRMYEYRYDLYTASEITNVAIPIMAAPFNQPSQAFLNGVAWRPGCDAGLAVGGQNNFSGTTAFVAYFRVLNGRRCAGDP
ncbi:MAG: hypothetical protein R3A52_32065 [Polyangiales bacterium]